jgi:hypothetical protein
MPALAHLDKSLNRLLADLAERLAASGADQILVRPDDLAPVSAECGALLLELGSLEPERTGACDYIGRLRSVLRHGGAVLARERRFSQQGVRGLRQARRHRAGPHGCGAFAPMAPVARPDRWHGREAPWHRSVTPTEGTTAHLGPRMHPKWA